MRVRRDRLGVVRLLRREPASATTCSRTACSRSTRARASASWHFQAHQARPVGHGLPGAADARHREARRAAGRRRRADHEDRATSTCSSARRASRSFRSSIARCRRRRSTASAPRDTQPFPLQAAAVRAADSSPRTMLTTRTPEAHASALETFREYKYAGMFEPPSTEGHRSSSPAYDGGGEWGGPAFDPETGLLYVNANEMAWLLQARAARRQVAVQQRTARAATATTGRARRRRRRSLDIAQRRIARARSRRSFARARAACRRSPRRSTTARSTTS